jgi:hypothetical protein
MTLPREQARCAFANAAAGSGDYYDFVCNV